MRRLVLLSALSFTTGCVTSPVFIPGLQHAAPLKSKGDISAAYVLKPARGMELSVATLVTDRIFVGGDYGESVAYAGGTIENSRFGFAMGWTRQDGDWHVQNAFGFTEGDSKSIFGGFQGVFTEGAPYMAVGRYNRIYAQRSARRLVRGSLEFGASARLSGVKVTGYRRFAGTPTTDGGINKPYNRDTTFSGNLSGLFVEPALFFGLNFRGIRVTPQVGFALPLTPSAFGVLPADAGISFSVSSEIFKAWRK